MTLETETILDRRQMRRKLSLWRSVAIAALVLAVGGVLAKGDGLSTLTGEKQIARIAIEGTILEDRDQLKMLGKIRDAANVEALLVFVNSPGGTTTGGEALFTALRDVAAKKPVVAQFGTVAASAGYIVGLGTDYIVVRGNTITGSIGVLAQWPEVKELLGKLGVSMNEVKSGDLKAQPNFFEPASPEARKVMQETIDDSFRWFLSLVETRRGVTATSIEGLVRGRIFSGRQAVDLKLADAIGGEAEAVRWLETTRGITKDIKIVDWKPEREGAWGVSSSLSGAVGSGVASALGHAARSLAETSGISRSGLDGLVSLWHPSEN